MLKGVESTCCCFFYSFPVLKNITWHTVKWKYTYRFAVRGREDEGLASTALGQVPRHIRGSVGNSGESGRYKAGVNRVELRPRNTQQHTQTRDILRYSHSETHTDST